MTQRGNAPACLGHLRQVEVHQRHPGRASGIGQHLAPGCDGQGMAMREAAPGVLACLAAAVAYAAYVLMAERSVQRGRDAFSLLAWGFLFAALFWALVQPWWTFPVDRVDGQASLDGRLEGFDAPVALLLSYVVLLGTIVPFVMLVTALHYIRATRATILAMLEPVLAALVAYAWLGEELTAPQIAGALLVLGGVGLAQSARPVTGST